MLAVSKRLQLHIGGGQRETWLGAVWVVTSGITYFPHPHLKVKSSEYFVFERYPVLGVCSFIILPLTSTQNKNAKQGTSFQFSFGFYMSQKIGRYFFLSVVEALPSAL